MGNSLQDQLLKSGLVSQEQLSNATKPARSNRPKAADRKRGDKRRKRPPQNADRERRGPSTSNTSGARGEVAVSQPSLPTLEELNSHIRKLLDDNRQNVAEAEVPYNFMRETRIKKLYVTEEQRRQLLSGELSIAGYRRVHHVIPTPVAEEILALRSEIFVHRAGETSPTASDSPTENETSPGAPSELDSTLPSSSEDVPDDLVW